MKRNSCTYSLYSYYLSKHVSRVLFSMYLKRFIFDIHSNIKWEIFFSKVLFVTTIPSVLLGILKKQCTAGISFDRCIMEYTQKNAVMLLTLGSCKG